MKNQFNRIIISLLVLLMTLTGSIPHVQASHHRNISASSGGFIAANTGLAEDENEATASEGGSLITTKQVYKSIIALKKTYPEGTVWTNDTRYIWNIGWGAYCYGCAGWVAMCSDTAFGDPKEGGYPPQSYPIKGQKCFYCPLAPGSFCYSGLRPGDILRINNDKHSVIILKKTDDYVIISEGNWGGKVHWGRKMTKSEVMKADHVITRYPDPPEITYISSQAGGVLLTWDWDGYSTQYKIYRHSETEKWTCVGTTEDCGYFDSSAGIDTYQYRIQSYSPEVLWSYASETQSVWHNRFIDITTEDDCFDAVKWAVNNKIVSGTSDFEFSPDAHCTRAQFCVMLWKLAGKPSVSGSCPFTDISHLSANVQKAIIWAYQKKIVKGKTTKKFDPDGDITRAQLSVMLYKMAKRPSVSGMENPFTDLGDYSGNVLNAITWAYNKAIISGTSDTTFSPDVEGTRRLLVMMMYQYNKIYKLK